MDCIHCNKPIILVPSAEERAAKDIAGNSVAHYNKLFREHTECALLKREEDTIALMRRQNQGSK